MVVDLNIFSLDVIKKVCYKSSFFSSLDIDPLNEQKVVVSFSFDEEFTEELQKRFFMDFNQDLVDEDLRGKVKEETEVIRNLILANAFSDTTLVDD